MQQDPGTPPRGTHSNGNGFPTTHASEAQTAGGGSARKSTLRFPDSADLMDGPPFLRYPNCCPQAKSQGIHPCLAVHAREVMTVYRQMTTLNMFHAWHTVAGIVAYYIT